MLKQWGRNFPLPRIQCGAPMGNGHLGFLLWGEKRTLHITMGCASLWDHRGGMNWTKKQNFKAVCAALYANDRAKLDEIFAPEAVGSTHHPSLIPAGRADVILPPGCELSHFVIDLTSGLCSVYFRQSGTLHRLRAACDMSCAYGLVLTGLPHNAKLKLHSGYELFRGVDYKKNGLCEHNSLAEHGFEPPEYYTGENTLIFRQPMPADPAYSVIAKRDKREIAMTLVRGEKPFEEVAKMAQPKFAATQKSMAAWWKNYWARVPQASLDNALMDELYSLGMYKYAILTNPAGVTPGIQGPWIEDDRLPPWQGDYHFNINVQMINSPGLQAGLGDHLKPLFEMVLSWRGKLRDNAEKFVGIDDGYMMPHAVDDRGTCMGAFWTGSIDHACAAWVAQMMYAYCDINSDKEYLRDKVFDFMRGTMRVFEMMMERTPDGKLALPVSVSPEFHEDKLTAWGKNSSFQLAAIHRLARNLLAAAAWLGVKTEPFWQEVEDKLPLCSLAGSGEEREIALWEGEILRESHRHHSHLGGLVPFDILNINDPEWQKIIQYSLFWWARNGMGAWTGWCVPWAAQIATRAGYAEAAVAMLNHWRNWFNNQTGASLHDSLYRGLTIMAADRGEVMQIDGSSGSATAIQEMLAHSAAGELHFFYGVPASWKFANFTNMHLAGGICASGDFRNGKTRKIVLTASREARLKIRIKEAPERVLPLELQPGESVILRFDAQGNTAEYF